MIYFYFNRNDSARQNPTVLLRALVKQLSISLPGLPNSVVVEYDKRLERGTGPLDFQESSDCLVSLLDLYPQTTIVIDALDESDAEQRGELLEALNKIVHASVNLVKIFISSRDDIHIKLILTHVPNIYIQARDNGGDIDRFVRQSVTKSVEKSPFLRHNVTEEFKEQMIVTIQAKANGM